MYPNHYDGQQIACPCSTVACGELVPTRYNARKGTVSVAACQKLQGQGWIGPAQAVLWADQAKALGWRP